MRSESLDRLFASLHTAGAEANAKTLEKKIWDLWMASDSPTAEVLLRQASKATDEGAPEEALKILDKLVERYPDFAEAWNRRATLYYLMRRYDAALADIEKVLELEPRHFGALAGRGHDLPERKKNYAAAIDAYREALTMNPLMEGPKEALEGTGTAGAGYLTAEAGGLAVSFLSPRSCPHRRCAACWWRRACPAARRR